MGKKWRDGSERMRSDGRLMGYKMWSLFLARLLLSEVCLVGRSLSKRLTSVTENQVLKQKC